ncbi:uncharacterized protein TNCV_5052831 [Trichonephila clavipes]|nr:uncharacterized protein TNCV_5052831 [Trichonephila clavipes]
MPVAIDKTTILLDSSGQQTSFSNARFLWSYGYGNIPTYIDHLPVAEISIAFSQFRVLQLSDKVTCDLIISVVVDYCIFSKSHSSEFRACEWFSVVSNVIYVVLDQMCRRTVDYLIFINPISTQGLLATDHLILNHGQVTWTTPELAPHFLTTTPHPREEVSALDRFNVHRCPIRFLLRWKKLSFDDAISY